jgi:hypothetical protein
MKKENSERFEGLFRLVVLIVSGVILGIWRYLIYAFAITNFLSSIIFNKRNKDIAELSEIWNTQAYTFVRYITGVSNERPFPFRDLKKNMSKFKK